MKVYAGAPAAARRYVKAGRGRADDYYLAEGTGIRVASKSLDRGLSWADEGGHGPCGGLRFSTPPTTSEMTHARVCIFPVRAAAGIGGCRRAAVGGRIDWSGAGADGDPGPPASAGSSSRSAVGAAAGA